MAAHRGCIGTHKVVLDMTAMNVVPKRDELKKYRLCLRVSQKPLCNGQILVRLYGTREDLVTWLTAEYGDDDGYYAKLIKERTSQPLASS